MKQHLNKYLLSNTATDSTDLDNSTYFSVCSITWIYQVLHFWDNKNLLWLPFI